MSDGLEQCLTPCRRSISIKEKTSGKVNREAGDGGGATVLNGVDRKGVSKEMTLEQKPERREGIRQVTVKR